MSKKNIKEEELENEVRNFFKLKFKDVKFADDVLAVGNFKINNYPYGNDAESYQNLLRFKKCLQVTINSFNNSEMYKDHLIKLEDGDTNDFNIPEKFLKRDKNKMTGRIDQQPDKEKVVKAISNYIACFLSIKKEEESEILMVMDIDQCSLCNYKMTVGEGNCSVCGATIKDIRENSKFRMPVNGTGNNTDMLDVRPENKEDATQVDINKWKCGACGYFNEYKNINCDKCGDLYKDGRWRCGKCLTENSWEFGDCQKCKWGNTNVEDRKNDHGYYGAQDGGERDLSKEDGGLVGNNDFMKEETNIKKWKCGGCELLNEYSVMNCVVCFGLYKDGKWTCGKCNNENSGRDDRCGNCNGRNANITVIEGDNKTDIIGVRNYENEIVVDGRVGDISGIVDRDKQTLIPVDKWRCTQCTVIQSYKNTLCEVCKSSRREFGEWMCAKCTLINKYDNEKCNICGEWNDNFPKKLCHDCNTNRVTGTVVQCEECARNMNMPWKCGYIRCGSTNRGIDEYCYECRFWRYNTYGRGDECKQQGQYWGINKGWICNKCDKFNDLDKSHCSKYGCKASRYAKISEVANMGERRDTKTGVEKGTGPSYKNVLVKDGSGGGILGIVDRDMQTHIPMDEWRCTYADCNTRQSYKYTVCQMCDRSRLVYGEWMCAKCKLINKCDNEKCLQCGEWNDYLPKKFCQYCKTNRVTGTEVRCGECARKGNMQWKCGYIKCGSMNRGIDEYCYRCRFWRNNTYGRGDVCRRQYGDYGWVNYGWICGKCETQNEVSRSHCSRMYCSGTRYA